MKTVQSIYIMGIVISLIFLGPNTACANDAISLKLVSGKVESRFELANGSVNGVAKVTNNTSRPLNALTLMVSYAMLDLPYGAPAKTWQFHKRKFSPPIPPGGSRNVKWYDATGYQYVVLDYTEPEWGAYLPSVWVEGKKIPCEMVQGRLYVAAQPMMNALGGTCEKDLVPGQKILKFNDQVITATTRPVKAGDHSMMPAKDFKNRSYIPLADLATRLSSTIAYTKDTNKYTVSLPAPKMQELTPKEDTQSFSEQK